MLLPWLIALTFKRRLLFVPNQNLSTFQQLILSIASSTRFKSLILLEIFSLCRYPQVMIKPPLNFLFGKIHSLNSVSHSLEGRFSNILNHSCISFLDPFQFSYFLKGRHLNQKQCSSNSLANDSYRSNRIFVLNHVSPIMYSNILGFHAKLACITIQIGGNFLSLSHVSKLKLLVHLIRLACYAMDKPHQRGSEGLATNRKIMKLLFYMKC